MSQPDPELASCLTSFYLPNPVEPSRALRYFRSEHNLDVNFMRFEDGKVCLRLCPSWFHTQDELQEAADILGQTKWRKLGL